MRLKQKFLEPQTSLYGFAIFISIAIAIYSFYYLPKPFNILTGISLLVFTWKYYEKYDSEKKFFKILYGDIPYIVKYEEIPTDKFLIGKGFLWTPEHTRVLTALIQDKESLEKGAAKGGLSFIHGVGMSDEKDVFVDFNDLVGHCMLVGSTRVGKTTAYNLFITTAIKKGDTVIVFDPKKDSGLLNRVYEACKTFGREKDFIFFGLPYPKISAYYNPLKNFTIQQEISDRIAMILPSAKGSTDTFKEFCHFIVSSVIDAMFFLGESPTLKKILDYSFNRMGELARKCIEKCFIDKQMGHILEEAVSSTLDSNTQKKYSAEYDELLTKIYISIYRKTPEVHNEKIEKLLTNAMHPKEHYQKMSASLAPTLSKFTTDEIGEILNDMAPIDRQVVSWDIAVKNKKVIYMCFGSTLLQDTARSVIKITMRDLAAFVGSTYCYKEEHPPIHLFIDEFSEVVDDSFGNFINKCGGANVRVYLATQSGADIEAQLGVASKGQQIYDNVNVKLWLRTADMKTAQIFSDSAGTVVIEQESQGYSVTPNLSEKDDVVFKSSYSQSISEKKTYLVDPSWILKLPKGQGFLSYAGKIYKVRIPLLPTPKENYLQETMPEYFIKLEDYEE